MGGLCPQIIRTGNKIYELKLKRKRNVCSNISFRDSFNWMPLKLAELPKALALNVCDKKFFPHKYNRPENIHIVRDSLPPAEHYCPGSFGTKALLKVFDEWYSKNKNTRFCFGDAQKNIVRMMCLS
jgi:hypothetical protein